MKKDISILSLSDFHFGHPKTKTETIITNIWRLFKNYHSVISKVDMIIFSGDTYHRPLLNGSDESNAIISFFMWLVNYCHENDILIRVLEGTSSHDYNQVTTIETIVNSENHPVDFKYIKILDIDYIEKFDINVGYIPDEWRDNSNDTYQEMKRLMVSRSILKLDLLVTHATYDFNLPIAPRPTTFIAEDMLQLTDNYIINGHEHTSTVYKRILYPGSFDRTAHGQEEKKGGFLIYLNRYTDNAYRFIENKSSQVYKTINISESTDIEKVFTKIKKVLRHIPDKSYINLKFKSGNPITKELNLFRSKFKNYYFKIESTKDIKESKSDNITAVVEVLDITPKNLKALLLESINGKLDTDEIKIFNSELSTFI